MELPTETVYANLFFFIMRSILKVFQGSEYVCEHYFYCE